METSKSHKSFLDKRSLEYIVRKITVIQAVHRQRLKNPAFTADIPFEIGLKLTNRCDLRCKHCFQWNDNGHHRDFPSCELTKHGDLDVEIIDQVLRQTEETNAALYLWGGEPLIYSYWDKLIDLLSQQKRQTVICTNGMKLMERMNSLCTISDDLTILVSIDGLNDIHNSIRGANAFEKVLKSVKKLIEMRHARVYRGKISISCVVSNNLVPQLYEFCDFWNELDIDVLFINYPWFLPPKVASKMDDVFQSEFSWLSPVPEKASWHSFDFNISQDRISDLKKAIAKIRAKKWNYKLQFHPDLDESMIDDFIIGSTFPAEKKTMCLGISSRLDIMPNGDVVSCKKFPEFALGNLHRESALAIWRGEKFRKFRESHNNRLMPICSKCEILYSNGV